MESGIKGFPSNRARERARNFSVHDGVAVQSARWPWGPTQEFYYAFGQANNTSPATQTITANRLHTGPAFFPREVRIDKLAINVTTGGAGGTLLRFGVYENREGFLYPGRLLFDSGSLAADAIAVVTAPCNLLLRPGKVYWSAFISDGAPVIRSIVGQAQLPVFGIQSSLGTNVHGFCYQSFTYAPLPVTYPHNATLSASLGLPMVAYRVAAAYQGGW